MLSATAFNTFLKTLEEPPQHAIFILATTEKHKIIPTILSRCQIFDFNRIRVEDIVGYLEGIAKKEAVKYDADALNIIALKADGAMRDALSIFDQIISFAGKKISYDGVIEHLNILDYEYYFKITDYFIGGDIPAALILLDEILGKGFDAHNFLGGLSAHMRDLLVCLDPVTLELLEVGAGIRDRYQEQSKVTPQDWLYRVLDTLGSADMAFKTARNQRLHLELTLMKICKLADAGKKKALTEETSNDSRQEETAEKPLKEAVEPKPVQSEEKTKPTGPGKRKIPSGHIPSIKDALNGTVAGEQDGPDKTEPEVEKEIMAEPFDHEKLLEQWYAFADKLRKDTPRMASSLKHHLPALKEDQKIEVIWSNSTQMEQFNREVKPELLRFLVSTLKNSSIRIEAVLSESEEKQNPLYTSEEKFEHMLRKNPNLVKLKERFNLDFE
jgi:DNA polymerase-3 subunit gamma/tau